MKVAGRNSDAGGGSAMNGGESTPTSSVQGLGATVRITEGTGEKQGSGGSRLGQEGGRRVMPWRRSPWTASNSIRSSRLRR